jgi:hypothetical protein
MNVAWQGDGIWFNPFSNKIEMVNGVYCACWDCTYMIPQDQLIDGGVFYTKSEYREHNRTRRRAYFARRSHQATKDGMARTKEITEAELVWEGQPVPTFFDIINGKWAHYEDPVHRFERMFGY